MFDACGLQLQGETRRRVLIPKTIRRTKHSHAAQWGKERQVVLALLIYVCESEWQPRTTNFELEQTLELPVVDCGVADDVKENEKHTSK